MYSFASVRSEKQISREIHRIFLAATFTDTPNVVLAMLGRIPALVLYNIFIPLQIAYGIQAIIDKRFDTISGYVLRIMLLALAYAALWSLGGWAICKNGIRASEYVQRVIFRNFLQKDYEFYNNTYAGALGSQATQLRSSFNDYSQMLWLNLPIQLVTIIAGIIVIALNSLTLATITLVAMAAVLSFTISFSKWRLKFRRQLSESTTELAGYIGDTLGHATTVKSFATEDYEEQSIEKPLAKWSDIQYKSWMSSLPADSGRMILAAVAVCALLITTSNLYKHHSISIAIITLVQLYVVRMITATEALAGLIKQYEAIMGSAYSSVKTMLVSPVVTDEDNALPLSKDNIEIAFSNVSYSYNDSEKNASAVSKFNLQVRPGEKIGLVGYSGSGKTTLTKLLLRFMDVSNGSIAIGGVNIRDTNQSDLRNLISYVPQEPLLFHRSVGQNILYGQPGATPTDLARVAKLAYADEFIDDLPQGYDTLVGERGVKLSGGQRQRVAIARALLRNSPILVLDEATSALDSRSEKLIQKALWHLMKDKTALVVAHRLSTIQHMDRIVVMDKGKIVQVGSHEELLKDKSGIYAELWTHQSGGYVGIKKDFTT